MSGSSRKRSKVELGCIWAGSVVYCGGAKSVVDWIVGVVGVIMFQGMRSKVKGERSGYIDYRCILLALGLEKEHEG